MRGQPRHRSARHRTARVDFAPKLHDRVRVLLAELEVRDAHVVEQQVEVGRALGQFRVDLARDLLALREQLLRVVLRDDALEHLVPDRGQHLLVEVLAVAVLLEQPLERRLVGAREHAQHDLDVPVCDSITCGRQRQSMMCGACSMGILRCVPGPGVSSWQPLRILSKMTALWPGPTSYRTELAIMVTPAVPKPRYEAYDSALLRAMSRFGLASSARAKPLLSGSAMAFSQSSRGGSSQAPLLASVS